MHVIRIVVYMFLRNVDDLSEQFIVHEIRIVDYMFGGIMLLCNNITRFIPSKYTITGMCNCRLNAVIICVVNQYEVLQYVLTLRASLL